ncbi:hypothetical protein MOKP76_23800 [Mycobacterium avium subsp. hominissuis]
MDGCTRAGLAKEAEHTPDAGLRPVPRPGFAPSAAHDGPDRAKAGSATQAKDDKGFPPSVFDDKFTGSVDLDVVTDVWRRGTADDHRSRRRTARVRGTVIDGYVDTIRPVVPTVVDCHSSGNTEVLIPYQERRDG